MTTRKPSYQEAMNEIEEILAKIESDEPDIDDLAEKVRRVAALIRFCRDKLTKTSEEVEKILGEMEEEESH
jgi:exodeoxyribonuclease VII small subunit